MSYSLCLALKSEHIPGNYSYQNVSKSLRLYENRILRYILLLVAADSQKVDLLRQKNASDGAAAPSESILHHSVRYGAAGPSIAPWSHLSGALSLPAVPLDERPGLGVNHGGDYAPLPDRLREVESFVERHPDHELRIAEPDVALLPGER